MRRAHRSLQCHGNVAESYARVPTDDDENCIAYLRRDPQSAEISIVVVNLLNRPLSASLDFDRSRRLRELRGTSVDVPLALPGGESPAKLPVSGSTEIWLPGHGYRLFVSGA